MQNAADIISLLIRFTTKCCSLLSAPLCLSFTFNFSLKSTSPIYIYNPWWWRVDISLEWCLGLEASTRYFDVLHFFIWSFYANFHRVWFFFAPLTINRIRWPLWFRQLVSFRIIPWCEWYLMFPSPFSIPLFSSNHWGRHDMVNLRAL